MNEKHLAVPILHVHGFGSSGFSGKARILKGHFANVFAPSLHPVPTLALDTLCQFIEAMNPRPLLVGSSLGGYYALYLSGRFGLPAVLVNPAIDPETTLGPRVGLNENYYDGARYEWTAAHVRSLRDYRWHDIDQEALLLLLQMGDTLLDHNETLAAFPHAERIVEPGGGHEFDGFERMLEPIRSFAEKWGGSPK